MGSPSPSRGLQRVVIEAVQPEVEGGRFAIKRVLGEEVVVTADLFADGRDRLAAVVRYQAPGAEEWHEVAMTSEVNDLWRAAFPIEELGRYRYTIEAWVDEYGTWRADLDKRIAAGQEIAVDLAIGQRLVQAAARKAPDAVRRRLKGYADRIVASSGGGAGEPALDPELDELVARHAPRTHATQYPRILEVWAEPELAVFAAWYELFPRSCAPRAGHHGTFADVERLLPEIAAMGFDILYLPPIHPIGTTFRKGPNNRTTCGPDDVGSPWAIGSSLGGHTAVHPELGTLAGFRKLVAAARKKKIEIALDIAIQASPDHPWVQAHPGWFRQRPDGTVQYAENPPKKYQDIYPLDFQSAEWRALWAELKGVFAFWIDQGVRCFRVDNPHTKPFAFWDWCIGELKAERPELIFLAEAFTRPKVMRRLARGGFTQSYAYFPWKNRKHEIVEFISEFYQDRHLDVLRPSHWTNTPDILHAYLQEGGRPAFTVRAVLAATLGASYGVYGPLFELMQGIPLRAGSEEYLDSEKYQLRHWPRDRKDNLRPLLTRLNLIRRQNRALQSDRHLTFHGVDNEQLLCFSKATTARDSVVLVCVNLDPGHTHSGSTELALEPLGLEADRPFEVHDLLSGATYIWQGARNFIELRPGGVPAHVFRVNRR